VILWKYVAESFGNQQRKDRALLDILTFLGGQLPADESCVGRLHFQAPLFALVNDTVYFINQKEPTRKRLVVPNHLKRQIMEECHGD
jgi:hypothetical protein